jgi:predicted phosphohydrolase
MKILVTADLHYDVSRSRDSVDRLAGEVCRTVADALILVGDTAGRDLDVFGEALKLFSEFRGRKLLVPGNHCLWCRPREDSIARYELHLPNLAAEHDFTVLDHEPVLLGGVALVGSIGWYDYSFADESLGVPQPFYEAKVSPGAAAYLGGHEELLEAHREVLSERHMRLGARWMDGENVRLGMSDEEFCDWLAERLDRQLQQMALQTDHIIAFMHHLPFRQLVPPERPDRFAFAAAYLGAGRLGEVLLKYPQIKCVYCGHSHWRGQCEVGHLKIVNVGSTYVEKYLEVYES